MFGPARLATESACRTRQLSLSERLSRLLKMQGDNPGQWNMTEINSYRSAPSARSAQVAVTQLDGVSSSRYGQELGLPRSSFFHSHSQPGGRHQQSSSWTAASGSWPLQPGRPSTSLPPSSSATYYQSYPATTFPRPPYSTSAFGWHWQRNSSRVSEGQTRMLCEHSPSKRTLHTSSPDSKKKPCPENKQAFPEGQQTSGNQMQMSSDSARSENGSTSVNKNPDMTRFKRRWKHTPLGKKHKHHPEEGVEVSILCYNVLAQCLIENNLYLYEDCPWDYLRWSYRKKNILCELLEAKTDIMCLQEVQTGHFRDFYAPELDKLGYGAIYQKRTGDKFDGCAMFYKKDKFELEEYKRVRFYRPNIKLLDRDNVGIIALLRPKGVKEAPKLCVATTHLLYNPKRGDIKLAQLGLLLAEIDHMAAVSSTSPQSPPAYHPILLCGDFNSLPHSPLYNLVRNSRLNYVGLQKVLVSGQGSTRRSFDPLAWPLWPYDVGLTDSCQFRSVIRARLRNGGNTEQEMQDENKQRNADQSSEQANASKTPSDWEKGFSDSINHPFHFTSVHNHDGQTCEVTTNHGRTNCTVDYIFFSSPFQADTEGAVGALPARQMAGELKLLGNRALMTSQEATDMGGLPNRTLSSDHFSLQAKFLLTVSK